MRSLAPCRRPAKLAVILTLGKSANNDYSDAQVE